MSNTLLKKVTASAAVLSIALSVVSPVVGVHAADAGTEAANRLAAGNVIVDNSTNPNAYKLGDKITRREMLKIMMNLSSVEVTEVCEGKFADLPKSDWGCKYAEAALKAGFIAGNAKFRPDAMVTEAEALKMVMQAKGVAKAEGVADWAQAYADAAVKAGILTEAKVSSNSAKRSFVFITADSANTNVVVDDTTKDTTGTGSEVAVDDESADDGLGDVFDDLGLGEIEGTDLTGTGVSSTGTTSTGVTSTGTTSTGVTVVKGVGNLEVTLSPTSPVSATFPSSAEGVKVAKYDVTAGDSDISVSAVTLKRAGIGTNVTIQRVALLVNGTRASNDKTFNSTSDEATVYFTTPLVVKAGSTVAVDVVGEMGAAGANNEFTVQLLKVESSAANVSGTFPVSANVMKVSSTLASGLVLSADGTVSDVKLGQTGVEIFKFKAKNNSSTSEDMNLSSITLKEDGTIDETTEMANIKLYADGTEIASIEKTTSKYFSFNLATPLFVKSGKTINFVVKADITGGAGDLVRLFVDKDLDVSATGTKNGYISITNGIDSTTVGTTYDVDVLAGALSLVTVEPTITELRKDKDDNILGTIKITSNAGKSLEIQKFKTTLTEIAALVGIDGVAGNTAGKVYALENVELYNPATQEIFDLDCVASGKDGVCSSTSLNIALVNGSTTELQLRADTTNNTLAGYKLRASVANIGTVAAADFYVVETSDDKQVTDITPSSVTFKTLEVKASGVTVNTLSMSATKSAVIGLPKVSMLEFEIKADSTSAITLDEVKVAGTIVDNATAGSAAFDKTRVSQISLYKDSISETNLIKTKSASDVSSNTLTFDSFKTTIAASVTQKFVVTVDFVNDENQASDTLKLALKSLSINDDQNDDITTGTVDGTAGTTLSSFTANSSRTVTIKGAGSLTTIVYTSESPLNNTQNLLGNTTSPVVAAFELTALNEDIQVKDLHIVATAGTLKNGVKNVTLLKADKTTVIATKSVSSNDVFFDDIPNFIITEGTQRIYVKVDTLKIGKDEAGVSTSGLTLKLQISDALGFSSSKVVSNPVDTSSATAFNVIPVNISAVGYESKEKATLADNASTVVAKVNLTSDTTTNTKTTDGATLKTKVEKLRFKVTTLSNLTAAAPGAFTIKRVNPLDGTKNLVAATLAVDANSDGKVDANDIIEFALTSDVTFGTNDEISGTASYEVSATEVVTTKTSNAYLKLEFVPSNTAGQQPVLFGDDDTGTGLSTTLTDTINFGQLEYNGN